MSDSFHNYERRLERMCTAIEAAPISTKNKRALLRFRDRCFSEGLSVPRVEKYIGHLRQLALLFDKDFAAATKADVERVAAEIERADLSEWTKRDHRITLKKFFRFLRGTKRDPPEVRWLRSDARSQRRQLPEELLTEDDVAKLIAACTRRRDRALISVLYETGCRIGEIAGLRVKHVIPHTHGFRLMVSGKTGARRLLTVTSAPYLTEWLNVHPLGSDPKAYLWITTDCRRQRLSYARVNDILRAAASRAQITKRVNPHAFRHARATHMANHFTEAQMKEYFGWVQGSDMASTYVHLSGRDLDHVLLKLNNVPVSTQPDRTDTFSLQSCPRCKLDNPPGNRFCSRCGTVLDERKAQQMIQEELKQSRSQDAMDRLVEDEEFRTFVRRRIKELGLSKR